MSEKDGGLTLKERVDAFQRLELPGQPMMMHMGTAYLVNALWRRVQELEALLAEREKDDG